MRGLGAIAVVVVLLAGSLRAQVDVQRGRLAPRPESTPAAAITAVGGQATPVWLAWQAPMVDGQASPCSTWGDEMTTVRSERLDAPPTLGPPAALAPPPRGLRLDAGTRIVVLARIVAGRVERLRAVGDDCPIDAAGQTVHWLSQVAPAASVAFLDGLAHVPSIALADSRRIAVAAITALSYHADPAATTALDRLTVPSADDGLRRQAARALARTRGAHGVERVSALLEGERVAATRRAFVDALAQSPIAGADAVLLTLARTDADTGVRGEAAYWHVRRAGGPGLPEARRLLDSERDEAVARRIVDGIARHRHGRSGPAAARPRPDSDAPVDQKGRRPRTRPNPRRTSRRIPGRPGEELRKAGAHCPKDRDARAAVTDWRRARWIRRRNNGPRQRVRQPRRAAASA